MEVSGKTLIQKLGIKSQLRVAVLGFSDFTFLEDIPFETSLAEGNLYDAILVQTERVEDLRGLRYPKQRVALNGALWIVYPKGLRTITQRQVLFAGNAEGFTDCKVCSFSATHTALKFRRRKAEPR